MARTEERLTGEKNTLSEGSSSHRAFKRRRAKVPFASQSASMRPGLESETGEKRPSVTANPIPLAQDTVLSGWNAKQSTEHPCTAAFHPNRKSKVKGTNYVWSRQQVKRLSASGNEQQWLMGPRAHTSKRTHTLLGSWEQ